jgi:alkaline phosphatase D
MQRRRFLLGTLAGVAGTPILGAYARKSGISSTLFTLGVASGDVTEDSAILWTRLAPKPLEPAGGMAPVEVPIGWELALDPDMKQVIVRGETLATPAFGHSVHIDARGLEPGRHYWYRFTAGTELSPIGRTKTLPAENSSVKSARFVTASCQNYTHGYFTAFDHMVADDPDFVIHLGDYIYDTSFGETFRQHDSEKAPVSLEDYRRRHALYKTDPHLQRAHAKLPFFAVIDNHDALEDADATQFAQRAAAYQAWYEHMPVRGYDAPGDNHFDMHRLIRLGELMQISLLDTRQFRDTKDLCTDELDKALGFGNYRERCDDLFPADRSMLGASQEQWLEQSLLGNRAAWNVIASSGPFLPYRVHVEGQAYGYIGAWDAYPANRARVADALARSTHGHPLILSGDMHSWWVVDGALVPEPTERIPVVEFVTSSISANWPEPLSRPVSENLDRNPQVKFYDGAHRGYLLNEVNGREWTATLRAVLDQKSLHSGVKDLARYVVKNGEPGLTRLP